MISHPTRASRSRLSRTVLLLPLLVLAAAAARPLRAQTALADSVRRDLWTSAFIQVLHQRTDLFDETLEHAVVPNEAWLRRLRPIPGEEDAGRPYYPMLTLYESYHDRQRNPRRWNTPAARARRFAETPGLADSLAAHAYRVLTTPAPATAADTAWKRRLLRLIQAGRIPSPQDGLGAIARSLELPDTASRRLRDQLVSALDRAPQGASDAARIQFAQAELRRAISNPDSVAGWAIVRLAEGKERIDRKADQIRALPEGPARDRAEEERDALLGYSRGQAQMAGAVLRLVDPEIGKAVVTVGEAALKASQAYQFLTSAKAGMNLATAAAMGDMVGAGYAVAQLFIRTPDPAAVRHQQLVRMLRQIGLQLEAIQTRLNVVDRKVTQILEQIQVLDTRVVDQTQALMQNLAEVEDRLTRAIAQSRIERSDEYRGDHLREVDRCSSLYPGHGLPPSTPERGDRLTECMRAFVTFGTNVGVRNTFIGRDLDWRTSPGLLGDASAVDYLGSLPGMAAELAAASRSRFPALAAAASPQTAHPGVVAAATLALIEISLRQPQHRMSDEREVFATLRQDLANYRAWSDSALARVAAPDGGGVAAYDSARAAVLREVQALETAYLQEKDAAGPGSVLARYCAATLHSDLPGVVEPCSRTLPRLTDPLEGRSPLELARYALYHGRGTPGDTWDWSPKSALREDVRVCCHGERDVTYYSGDGTFTLSRTPSLGVADGVVLEFLPLSTQATVSTGWHGRSGHAEHWRQESLKQQAGAFQPAPGTWTAVPTQRWLADSAYAAARTEAVVGPLRAPFARHLTGLLAANDGRVQGLRQALTRLDHVIVAWRGFERLALGECFATRGLFSQVSAARPLSTSESLTRLLREGRLLEFVHALDATPTQARATLPGAPEPLGACSRIPPDIETAIGAIDRYLALRNAEPGR